MELTEWFPQFQINVQVSTRPLQNKTNRLLIAVVKTMPKIHVVITRAIPKVSGLDILDNNNFHNLYISETYILYEL